MRPVCLVLIAILLGGCGGGGEPRSDPPGPQATTKRLPDVEGADRGRRLVAQSGCLACHRIGEMGSEGGPGPSLTEVGQRMPRSAIRRTLVAPTPPMPSYADLEADELDELARYLSGLGR